MRLWVEMVSVKEYLLEDSVVWCEVPVLFVCRGCYASPPDPR